MTRPSNNKHIEAGWIKGIAPTVLETEIAPMLDTKYITSYQTILNEQKKEIGSSSPMSTVAQRNLTSKSWSDSLSH